MLFRKKSKARIKAERKIKELKRQNRDLRRKAVLFMLLTAGLFLMILGLPFAICLNLIFVFGRPAGEALLMSVIAGIILPFLLVEQIRKLAGFGEQIVAEHEMRKWLKRRGMKSKTEREGGEEK